jgi:SAM-dependent methyltransferase
MSSDLPARPAGVAMHDRFDQEAVWGRLRQDPTTERRVRMFRQMIPDEVERIVDVGCGDGAITNRLAQDWDVTGVDLSAAALAHLETTALRASATALPLPDNSFDLVMSIEVLEHLSDSDYRRAISEMQRVTRRYLLISVPYREDLASRMVRCPACGWRGHVFGHQRRFTAESLLTDLEEFEIGESRIFGPLQEPPWPRWLIWTAHNVFRSFYWSSGQHPMCERCQNTDFTTARGIPWYLDRLKRRIQPARAPRMPFWLAVLVEAR